MANSEEENQVPLSPNPKNGQEMQESSKGDDEEDDYDEVEDDEDVNELELPARVHDVIIKGNTKTRDWVIEAEVEGIKKATTMRELVEMAQIANAKLHSLQIFDSVNIKLEPGPSELAGTANVIIEVSETDSKLSGEVGVYSKPSVQSFSLFVTNGLRD